MSLDYLGRKWAADPADVERLLASVSVVVENQPVVVVVAVAETMIAEAILPVARSRADAHEAVDKVAGDIKEYLTARLAEQDQRRDVVGHA